MRREIIWAAAVGISFGLIIAFGVWRINSSLKPKAVTPQITPTPEAVGQTTITLDKPENDDVITESPVTVSGITKPLTWLIFSGEKGDYIVQSDSGGVFSQDVDLTAGANQIKVTSLNAQGDQTVQKVLVVYSSSFQPNPSSSPGTATSDADINQEVAQKVSQALNRPKAYIGTVTDIADSTIQVKTPDSQIEQISIAGNGITVVDTKGTNNKQVKLTDIAIGDFVIAMGYVNGNKVLSAQRILIADPIEDLKLSVSLAKVTAATKKSLTVTDVKSGESATLTPDKNTAIASFVNGKTGNIKITAVATDDLLIYVSDISGTPPLLRSVFDIGKPQG